MSAVKFDLPNNDPQNYVKLIPPPTPKQIGVKIQARTDFIYNPSEPTRDEIRKVNFTRRYRQLHEEGFLSPCWKPYQGIGDPVYLDDRELIVDTLGLPKNDDDKDGPESGTEDDNKSTKSSKRAESVVAADVAKLMQGRLKKDRLNLKAVLRHSEEIGKYVRIGHSFFDILEKEKKDRLFKERQAKELAKYRARTEIQPPKYGDSSSEEDFGDENRRSMSAAVIEERRDRKRRKFIPRPYTPVHCTIVLPVPQGSANNPGALTAIFRQLCCLHWFLEAMSIEPPAMMKPITTSWVIREGIGKGKLSNKMVKVMKETNTVWDKFTSQKRFKKRDLNTPKTSTYASSMRQTSSAMSFASPTSTRTDHDLLGYSTDEAEDTDYMTDDEGLSIPNSPRKSSVRSQSRANSARPASVAHMRPSTSSSPPPGSETSLSQRSNRKSTMRKLTFEPPRPQTRAEVHRIVSSTLSGSRKKTTITLPFNLNVALISRAATTELARCITLELDAQSNIYQERKAFRQNLMERHPRLTSAPQLSDPKLFPSQNMTNLVSNIQLNYEMNIEDKAIDMQYKLEHMARYRDKVCQGKLLALPEKGAPHRAISEMRAKSRYDDVIVDSSTSSSQQKQSHIYAQWWGVLLDNLTDEVAASVYISKILEKLRVFAITQTSKHTSYKLTKVLQTMAAWELCHPHVTSALLFLRHRIVDMSDDQFDDWFTSSHPSVARLQMDNQAALMAHLAAGGRVGEPAPGSARSASGAPGTFMTEAMEEDESSTVTTDSANMDLETGGSKPRRHKVRPMTK